MPVWFPFNQEIGKAECDREHVCKEIWLVAFLLAGMKHL